MTPAAATCVAIGCRAPAVGDPQTQGLTCELHGEALRGNMRRGRELDVRNIATTELEAIVGVGGAILVNAAEEYGLADGTVSKVLGSASELAVRHHLAGGPK